MENIVSHFDKYLPFDDNEKKQSIRIEVFGDLHEFGALGKTVTIAEAKSKISHA